MFIANSETQSKKCSVSKACNISECNLFTENFSVAVAGTNGRYPDQGMSVNMKCEQIYYCLSGQGIIHSDQGDFNIEKGDIYYFELQEKYFVEGKKLEILIINTPRWNKEQYKYF